MRFLLRLIGTALLLFAGLVLAFVIAGYAEATRDPVVVRYRVALADWPPGAPPLRIVQMSDIHFAWPDMPARRIARIVAQVDALKPDLIALTGDYSGGKFWDRDIGDMDDAIAPLRALRARLGVVVVRGNHDGPYWTPIVFADTGFAYLKNRWIDLGRSSSRGWTTARPGPIRRAPSSGCRRASR